MRVADDRRRPAGCADRPAAGHGREPGQPAHRPCVEGTATDRAVDGKLGDASHSFAGGRHHGDASRRAARRRTGHRCSCRAAVAERRRRAGRRCGKREGAGRRLGSPRRPVVALRLADVQLVGALRPRPRHDPRAWWARGLPRDPARARTGPARWLPTPFSRARPLRRGAHRDDPRALGHGVSDPARAGPRALDLRPEADRAEPRRLAAAPASPGPTSPARFRTAPATAMRVTEPWRPATRPSICWPVRRRRGRRRRGACAEPPRARRVASIEWRRAKPLGLQPAPCPWPAAFLRAMAELWPMGSHRSTSPRAGRTRVGRPPRPRRPRDCEGGSCGRRRESAEPSPHGNPRTPKFGSEAWDRTGFKPSDRADSLRSRRWRPYVLGLLLLVPRRIFDRAS